MSELIHTHDNRATIRWKLLTGASAMALTAYVASSALAKAEDADRPTIWIELGGQLETNTGSKERFIPPFIATNMDMHLNATSPLSSQHLPPYMLGGEGKLSFQPSGSDWVFSAAVRFGRTKGGKSTAQHTQSQFSVATVKYAVNHGIGHVTKTRFNNSDTEYAARHTVVDFKAGRDVGLGLFGHDASSTISGGVRIGQFDTGSDVTFNSRPYNYVSFYVLKHPNKNHFYSYHAHSHIDRSFRGIGPSISWDGAAPLAGNPDKGQLSFDWGASAALLFGRQKVHGAHQTTGNYFTSGGKKLPRHYTNPVPVSRSKSVAVPNIGVFAGLSVKYPNAKISIGYRYDTFLKAMDTGIDARKSSAMTFQGPYASISIGLGN